MHKIKQANKKKFQLQKKFIEKEVTQKLHSQSLFDVLFKQKIAASVFFHVYIVLRTFFSSTDCDTVICLANFTPYIYIQFAFIK